MNSRLKNAVRLSLLGLLPFIAVAAVGAAEKPLPQAHAHNDYVHERPLLDALDHGFCSVEADIYLINGALLVAHNEKDVKPERTMQALYLDPLLARVRANNGSVYLDAERFILLVDIKSDGEATYAALRDCLQYYQEMLTTFTLAETKPKAVTVIVSGNRPIATMSAEPLRYAAVDGRLADLNAPVNKNLMPLISESWRGNFDWFGTGEMPAAVRDKLTNAVTKAHENGCLIRFWAIPAREEFWQAMLDAKVDFINADNLAQLEMFLRGKK